MTKFYNRYSKCCRYKYGDIVTVLTDITPQQYIVINATWSGNSNGFWYIEVEQSNGFRMTLKRPKLKKIRNIFDK